MKNRQPIIVELVSSIEAVCFQINRMMEITGRPFPQSQLQILIDNRVEEFKTIYPEIPKDAKFTIVNNKGNMLFINSNQAFRNYAEVVEKAINLTEEVAAQPRKGFINTLH